MIAIRPATLDDVDRIHALGESTPEFAVNDKITNFWPKSILVNAIRSNDVIVLVSHEEQNISGFIIASYSDGLKKATIENLLVDEVHRHNGIGRLLLRKLLQALDECGCEYVATLIPRNADSAMKTYLNTGFEKGEVFLWLDYPLSAKFKKSNRSV